MTRMEATVERSEIVQIERVLHHELKSLFAPGAVQRGVLLQHDDDPAIPPGQLLVRVLIPAPPQPEDYQQVLAAWQDTHRAGMEALRRELSLRLPPARLLEFTFENPDTATPRLLLPDDGPLAAEQPSGRQIVTRALALLRANYVFPELAEQAAAAVEARLAAGEYDDLDEIALTDLLTSQLQEITDDKHLALRLGGGPGPRRGAPGPDRDAPGPDRGGPGPDRGGPGPSPGSPDARPEPGPGPGRDRDRGPGPGGAEPKGPEARTLAIRQMGRVDNFGIHRVERLPGNIGYLDVRRVAVPAFAGPAISAAMELVVGTYALVIDLRRNGGGAPEGVVLWCSYLFSEESVHLNDIYHAGTGETRQFWSLPYLPGSRYVDRPVYVLTSNRTFSGGEDFCYTLQAAGRAELIGETTGGGAHPTRGFPISPAVHIAIPFARSINPVTGTNWQGTGVVPDIAVPAAKAYDVAYARALAHVLALDDLIPPVEHEAREALAGLPPTASTPAED